MTSMTDKHSLFGTYNRGDPSLNVPVTGSISPYMNFDPAVIGSPDSQFILLEGATAQRGRFELSFGIIGSAVMAGGAFGGASAMLGERQQIRQAFSSNVARAKLLNAIGKQSASAAQAWGAAALLYSGIVVIVSKLRGADDELNTLFSGASAGMVFYSSSGLKRSLMGGAGGLGIACLYCLATSRDRIKRMIGWS